MIRALTGALGTAVLAGTLGAMLWASSRPPRATVTPAGWGMVVLGATTPTDPSTCLLDPWTDPIPQCPAITPETGWQEAGRWAGWLANQSPALPSTHG